MDPPAPRQLLRRSPNHTPAQHTGRPLRSRPAGDLARRWLTRDTAKAVSASSVELDDGRVLPADFVVTGIGVRPVLGLAQTAGIAVDRGVVVNEYLETNVPEIFAAGDSLRVETELEVEGGQHAKGLGA